MSSFKSKIIRLWFKKPLLVYLIFEPKYLNLTLVSQVMILTNKIPLNVTLVSQVMILTNNIPLKSDFLRNISQEQLIHF